MTTATAYLYRPRHAAPGAVARFWAQLRHRADHTGAGPVVSLILGMLLVFGGAFDRPLLPGASPVPSPALGSLSNSLVLRR